MVEVRPVPSFIVGEVYRRRSLHLDHGGQWQGGISTSSSSPVIFLFTGDSGHQYGYRDGEQPDGTYWYTGEGQEGDMRMERGNLAIRDHEKNGRDLHLFKALGGGMVQYLGQALYLDHHEKVASDRNEKPRRAIVFELELTGSDEGRIVQPEPAALSPTERRLWKESLETLRQRALERPEKGVSSHERKQRAYLRSEAVRIYVLRRAEGRCEGCREPAPFKRVDGTPYLEPHHLRRLADEGPDHPRWVAALCPNCHRRVHSGEDRAGYNEKISRYVLSREA
ncbi:MAG TPA: HNH endonuclease [Thermoanaerobaculia bacterium]|nr:HNH endonuclease [Thermoanaerobaculia bacterium]